VGLTRSGRDIGDLIAALDEWSDGTVAHDVAVAQAQAGQRLVRRGFAEAKAPDGTPWRPLAASTTRGRPRKPLRKTGKLADAAALYLVDRDGFVFAGVGWFAYYGGYHQSEAPRTRLPRRPFYPDESGIPTGWSIVLGEAADEAAQGHIPR